MPEFEGNTEPIIMACSRKVTDGKTDTVFEIRETIAERVTRLADRVVNWTRLADTPKAERKVIFVLHKKGAGLSCACWPDIPIGTRPHLYIYNADNPAEGVVAKRRSNAVLVDHLQAVMTTADTYGGFEELEELLDEHQHARVQDPAGAHQLEHLIREAIDRHHLTDEIGECDSSFDDLAVRCHEIISSVKNSQTRVVMRVLGDIPEGGDRAETINTILRFDSDNPLNTRRLVFFFRDPNRKHSVIRIPAHES